MNQNAKQKITIEKITDYFLSEDHADDDFIDAFCNLIINGEFTEDVPVLMRKSLLNYATSDPMSASAAISYHAVLTMLPEVIK